MSKKHPFSLLNALYITQQKINTMFVLLVIVFASFAVSASPNQQTKFKQIVQLAEYIGVDYVAAVGEGEVLDADEYQEMLEFSNVIVDQANLLSSQGSEFNNIKTLAGNLKVTVYNKGSVVDVRAVSSDLRAALLKFMPQLSLPGSLLPITQTQALYQQNCAACHGISGQGNGPLAKNLTPEPTNFTDAERAHNRSLMGLFDAVTNGLDNTPMVAFTQFNEQQRWSLAFYVGSLAFKNVKQPTNVEQNISAAQIVNLNPAQLTANSSEAQTQYVHWLRGNPEHLFTTKKDPLAVARSQLIAAQQAHALGNYSQASDLAISAYLDGFELVENNLNAYDETLRKNIEVQLMALRKTLKQEKDTAIVAKQITAALTQLEQAGKLLSNTKLTNSALLWASLVILLREGLEALLVVLALMTVLIKTQRQDALKYVHIGWITALIAGGLTWAAAQSLIEISGASREVMEGVGAMFAAVILLYVGVWMHSKTSAQQWQAYIQDNINKRLESGTLWGLAGLSFIAVYREVFETVLFYQSLLTQSTPEQYSSIAMGFVIALAILGLITWVLIKYSIKLPIAKFFAITTYLLFALSFVLMGKAITALQEADIISISGLAVNIDIVWLGVKSTWEGVIAQLIVVAIFAFYILKGSSKK
ncbi:high-affinity iron transporter [Pseudoalteromonas translucida KMM 520]|uniref:High-affinity iron transporter n=2 Tax=Pseudoalteromonas translucida TaxID=166935 RepID=A0A0U2WJ71_9GAMM|nr:cytochrome c/FTR1 family iron permease [Pseudoalteromonas translucida]ALS35143.1 high-affinity iron transporter [Pseudoalteromonas translucida KMM 520]